MIFSKQLGYLNFYFDFTIFSHDILSKITDETKSEHLEVLL